MDTIKYGLIGCGRISKYHLSAALENGLQVAAVCDILPEAMEAETARQHLTETRKYTDYLEMLAKEDLDLVAISTESGKHAQIALDCIERGVHVIIEKPMALSIEDADRIIEASARKNVKVSVCHQNRFNKSVQKVREAIERHELGKMMHATANIRWNRGKSYYDQAKWRGTWAQDGGTLMNQCIHNIDLLRWMMGDDIEEVFAYTDRLTHPYIEAEDLGIALIKFANGGYGVIEGTTNIYQSNFEETLSLFGTDGTVKIGGKSVNTIEHWQINGSDENVESLKKKFSEDPPDVYGFGHTPLYRDVLLAIKEDRAPAIDAKAGKNAMELVLAIYKSSAEGVPVKLPMAAGATLDFIKFDQGVQRHARQEQ